MWIYELTIEDATTLGGRMGTEYTTPLRSELFVEWKGAAEWLHVWLEPRIRNYPMLARVRIPVKEPVDHEWSVDGGCYLFTIRRRNVK